MTRHREVGRLATLRRVVGRIRSADPRELPHRAVEQVRKIEDRRGWTAARLPELPAALRRSPLPRLPANEAAIAAVHADERARVRDSALRLLADDVVLLGRRFPSRRAWDHDPETGTTWPAVSPWSLDLHADVRDVNLAWELHRLQHLQVLALAARFGLDGAAEAVVADLRDWASFVRPFDGVAWAGGIEASLRVASLLTLAGLLPDGAIDADLRGRLWDLLLAHGVWLERYPSLGSGANNHRLAELVGLVLLGRAAPALPGAARFARAVTELRSLGASLFYEDGVGTEQSATYQAFTMELLLLAGRVVDLGPEVRARLAAAVGFFDALDDGQGHRPGFGDDDEGRVLRPRIDEPDYVSSVVAATRGFLAGGGATPPDGRAALLGVAGSPPATPAPSATFPNGGYTALRGPGLLVVVDHGPLGFWSTASHGHADALALWVHVDGRPVLVDRGTFTYNNGGGWREYARSTAAHNTVEVGGASQSQPRGLFNWGRRAAAGALDVDLTRGRVSASHDGYGPNGHQRDVGVVGRTVVVTDHVDRDGVVVWWHFAPDVAVVVRDGVAFFSREGAVFGSLIVENPDCGLVVTRDGASAGPGTHSAGYGVAVAACSLAVRPPPGTREIRTILRFDGSR